MEFIKGNLVVEKGLDYLRLDIHAACDLTKITRSERCIQ